MSKNERQSFLQRLSRYDNLLFAAFQIASKRYEETVVPDDLWHQVKTEIARVEDTYFSSGQEDRGGFTGDIIAACLRGFFLAEDAAIAGELAKTEKEPETIRGRNSGRFDTWPKREQVALYELELQRGRLTDKVDLGSRIAHVILDEGKRFNQRGRYAVQDFQALRREAGVTRSGLYRDGDEVKEDFRFMRRTKDSVRMLLEKLGETNLDDDVEVPEERKGMAAFYKAAAREARRNERGDLEFAIRRSRQWLLNKESQADQIALVQEIEGLQTQKKALDSELAQARESARAATVAVVKKIRLKKVEDFLARRNDVSASLQKAEERLTTMRAETGKMATLGEAVAANRREVTPVEPVASALAVEVSEATSKTLERVRNRRKKKAVSKKAAEAQ